MVVNNQVDKSQELIRDKNIGFRLLSLIGERYFHLISFLTLSPRLLEFEKVCSKEETIISSLEQELYLAFS